MLQPPRMHQQPPFGIPPQIVDLARRAGRKAADREVVADVEERRAAVGAAVVGVLPVGAFAEVKPRTVVAEVVGERLAIGVGSKELEARRKRRRAVTCSEW
jgi:hypothetical protein